MPKTEYQGVSTLENLIKDKSEPSFLANLRQQAFSSFKEKSWPGPKDEEWRRTRIWELPLDDLTMLNPDSHNIAELASNELDKLKLAGKVVYDSGAVKAMGSIDQLSINTLAGYVSDDKKVKKIEPVLKDLLETSDNRLLLWNLSAFENAIVIEVPNNAVIEDAVKLDFSFQGEDVVYFPNLIVMAGQSSQVEIIIEFNGGGELMVDYLSTFVLGKNTQVKVSAVQQLKQETIFVGNSRSVVPADARFNHFEGHLGAGFAKGRVDVELSGAGADLNLDGVYFGIDDKHIDLRTVQHHNAPNATSNTYYKGIVRDEARSIYQGLIEVSHEAKGTDAYLSNKNIVMNDGARADSIPSLQINTDDVRCSHGSTTGKLDEALIFYLQSRGFSRDEAVEELLIAFFEDLLGKTSEYIQEDIKKRIHQQLIK
jgi:Fe-S cluster assembly protein SufD